MISARSRCDLVAISCARTKRDPNLAGARGAAACLQRGSFDDPSSLITVTYDNDRYAFEGSEAEQSIGEGEYHFFSISNFNPLRVFDNSPTQQCSSSQQCNHGSVHYSASLRAQFCTGGLEFTVTEDTQLPAGADELLLTGQEMVTVLGNLIDNALEATRLQTTLPDRQQALAIFDQRAREFKRNAPDQAAANYYFIQNQLYQLDLSQAGCTDWQQLQQQAAQVQSRFMTDARYQAPISGVKLAVDAYINANCE